MNVTQTAIPGLSLIEIDIFADDRGYFLETYQAKRYRDHGIPMDFVQDNLAFSKKDVLRGFHYQSRNPQAQLFFVNSGSVFAVFLDVRQNSPTFGQWHNVTLNDKGHHQVYMAPGIASAYYVQEDTALIGYKVTRFYDPTVEAGVLWNDSELGIPWPEQNPILSPRDAAYPRLRDIDPDRLPPFTQNLTSRP